MNELGEVIFARSVQLRYSTEGDVRALLEAPV